MNYEIYTLSFAENSIALGIYVLIDGTISYFFYRSFTFFLILLPGFFAFRSYYRQFLISKRKKRLLEEFSEALYSISINVKAGYSLENAFGEAYKDMSMFYKEKSLMADEILRIKKGLAMNKSLEELLEDFAIRSNEEEIRLFGAVCKNAKRNGGNITEVLTDTADRIRESICVDAEIETILSEKKLELRIMQVMPFLILAYMQVTSVGYFDVLYKGIRGRLFMSVALAMYIAAVIIGNRLVRSFRG